MKKRMSDDELLAIIENHEKQAIGYYTGEIAHEQAQAQDYYLSKPFGTEEEGRSSVISSDVWDVIEGLTPIVLKPFVASDDVVRFNPLGPDDEDAASQESDYVNWVVTQKNDVFNELVAAVKTGLLQKNAVAKYWWEKSRKATIERYFGLSDDEFSYLSGADVEIIEHTETEGPHQMDPQTGQMVPGEPMHDVTVRTVDHVGEAKYCVIPPEEFLIGRDTTTPNPKKSYFVQHRRKVTVSYLREMGYDVDDEIQDGGEDPMYSQQYIARRSDEENSQVYNDFLDPASREVLYKETLILVDVDGDGMTELRKVCSVGREILANEETEEINFVAWTPYPQPFKFYGRCPADETKEIQLIKSTLWRQSLDNIYTINNNRVYASNKVNLDDLLDNQIAGVVRVDGDDVGRHVVSAQITPIGQVVQPMIEYLDSAKENRTGFTRYNQGADAESLNKTATGVRIIKEAGDTRTELISRAFAEQFLAPLMLGIHGLCRRHATKAETVRLRGEWVNIDPRQWKTRSDMTVSVGLGTSDQQMRMQGVQLMMGAQMNLHAAGIVTPTNLYNAAKKLAESVGYKNPEQFFTAPDKMPQQQPPPPDPAVLKLQADQQATMAKLQADQQAKGMDHQTAMAELQLEARKVAVLEHDSMVRAQTAEATVGLQAQAQGLDNHMQIMDAINSLQTMMHSIHIDRVEQQRKAQADLVDQHLQVQGQAHDQKMAEQSAALAQHTALNPPTAE